MPDLHVCTVPRIFIDQLSQDSVQSGSDGSAAIWPCYRHQYLRRVTIRKLILFSLATTDYFIARTAHNDHLRSVCWPRVLTVVVQLPYYLIIANISCMESITTQIRTLIRYYTMTAHEDINLGNIVEVWLAINYYRQYSPSLPNFRMLPLLGRPYNKAMQYT